MLRGNEGATANACRIKPVPEACASKQPDLAARTDESVGRADLMVPDFARAPAIAQDQVAVGNDAAADARTQGQEYEVLRLLAGTEGVFSERRTTRVVADVDGQREALAQRLPEGRVPPTKVRAVEYGPGSRVDVARRADADAGDIAAGRLDGGADSLDEHLDDLVELQVVEVLLVLSVDRSVVRNDPSRNV